MSVIAIIPVKRLTNVKQRLASRLYPSERSAFVLRCLQGELAVLDSTPGIAETIVVTCDPQVTEVAEMNGASVMLQLDNGVNAAARLGITGARERGATNALILHADLPFIAAADIEALLRAAKLADAVVAPDRKGQGTNALLLPTTPCVRLAYGRDSYRQHVEHAREAGLDVETVHRPGIAFDLDTPSDLLEYRRRLRQAVDTGGGAPGEGAG